MWTLCVPLQIWPHYAKHVWRKVLTSAWCALCVPLQICPHYGEHVWRKVLKKAGQGIRSGWPAAGPTDMTLKASNKYLQVSTVLSASRGSNKYLQVRTVQYSLPPGSPSLDI